MYLCPCCVSGPEAGAGGSATGSVGAQATEEDV